MAKNPSSKKSAKKNKPYKKIIGIRKLTNDESVMSFFMFSNNTVIRIRERS